MLDLREYCGYKWVQFSSHTADADSSAEFKSVLVFDVSGMKQFNLGACFERSLMNKSRRTKANKYQMHTVTAIEVPLQNQVYSVPGCMKKGEGE